MLLTIGSVVLGIAGLVSIVCFIIVLIKLFQEKGALHGILGFFCNLYPFIWGWIESARLNLKKIMLYWTLSIVLAMVGYGLVIAGAVTMQQSLQDMQPMPQTEEVPAPAPAPQQN